MDKLNVGIIGLGVGEKHIKSFQSHNNCEVVTLCDFANDKRKEISIKYPEIKIINNALTILEDQNINIVSVASFDNYHYKQIISALKNGKHVFVEKPLCLYEQEAQDIRRCLNEHSDLRLSSNLGLRTCPRFKRIRDVVRSGEMGHVYYIEGDYLWGRIHKLTDGWRKDMNYYSIIHGAAIHMIDLVLWITGLRPVEVQAYGNNIANRGTPLNDNSFATILMKFENGCIAKVTANGGCIHPHFHRLVVFGTKKTAIHDLSGAMWLDTNDPSAIPEEISEKYPAKEKRGDVITSFVDSIIDNSRQPIVTADDAFDTMSICIAAEKAVNESRHVMVNYY